MLSMHIPDDQKLWLAFDPEFNEEEAPVRFRLTYEGRLQSNGSPKHKHEIRRQLHPQLKRLWQVEPNLKDWKVDCLDGERRLAVDALKSDYSWNGFNIVPLATEKFSIIASLEIIFLRYGEPGKVISKADIDNRLKTLFDALCFPRDRSGLPPGEVPGPDEDPFYVLLEDDGLIDHISVETDTLLAPTPSAEGRWLENDARVLITARIRPHKIWMQNLHLV